MIDRYLHITKNDVKISPINGAALRFVEGTMFIRKTISGTIISVVAFFSSLRFED